VRLGKLNLPSLSIDELWALHEEVGATLSKKIASEKRELEERLVKLNRGLIGKLAIKRAALQVGDAPRVRRAYPPVLPKFQNPADPTETWAGRGKQPRWLVAQLKAGRKTSDFLIDRDKRPAVGKRRQA
jgi:DNA-binding protein H-NS